MERNIDHRGSPKPRAAMQARIFGDMIDIHTRNVSGAMKATNVESLQSK
jgi:hypothetical protein